MSYDRIVRYARFTRPYVVHDGLILTVGTGAFLHPEDGKFIIEVPSYHRHLTAHWKATGGEYPLTVDQHAPGVLLPDEDQMDSLGLCLMYVLPEELEKCLIDRHGLKRNEFQPTWTTKDEWQIITARETVPNTPSLGLNEASPRWNMWHGHHTHRDITSLYQTTGAIDNGALFRWNCGFVRCSTETPAVFPDWLVKAQEPGKDETKQVTSLYLDALRASAMRGLIARILVLTRNNPDPSTTFALWSFCCGDKTPDNGAEIIQTLYQDALRIGYWFMRIEGRNDGLQPVALYDPSTGQDWHTLYRQWKQIGDGIEPDLPTALDAKVLFGWDSAKGVSYP